MLLLFTRNHYICLQIITCVDTSCNFTSYLIYIYILFFLKGDAVLIKCGFYVINFGSVNIDDMVGSHDPFFFFSFSFFLTILEDIMGLTRDL